MPRFYFHFEDGNCRRRDADGMILPDAEAAWYQAVRSARDLFGEDLLRGDVHPGLRVEIEDEEGRPVLDLPIEEVARSAL